MIKMKKQKSILQQQNDVIIMYI